MRRAGRTAQGVAAGLVLVLAAGCSSDSEPRFETSDLSSGACRDAGDELLAVETSQRRLAADEIDAAAAAEAYEDLQDRLLEAREDAPDDVGDALRRLVTSMGFFRVGVAAGTLGDAQVDQVRDALDDTLTACGVDLQD